MKLTRRAALQSAAAAVLANRVSQSQAAPAEPDPSASIVDLRVDYVDRPLGLEARKPLLSWRMESAVRGAAQTSYRILVARSEATLLAGQADVWDSGVIASSRSFGIPYAGPALASGQRVYWLVEVLNEKSLPVRSAPSWWEMGLLDPRDWTGEWLVAEDAGTLTERAVGLRWIWGETQTDAAPRQFRWRFTVESQPEQALLMISAKDNLQALWIDGEHVLSPDQWLPWGAFTIVDVTQHLAPGQHVLALEVSVRTDQARPTLGGALTGYLRLKRGDGSVLRLPTGSHWRTALKTEGESDAWTTLDYNDASWSRSQSATVRPDSYPWLPAQAVLLRREFRLPKPIARARLYATALGAYELSINGQAVSDRRLAPESTDFRSRALYQTYDVTSLLRQGGNAIGAHVADGWFASAFSYIDLRYAFGPPPRRFIAQLDLIYADGSRERIRTDATWKLSLSPVLTSEIYNGENYDARLEQKGWDTAGFNDARWTAVTVGTKPPCKLSAQVSPPIRIQKTLKPLATNDPSQGVRVYDFGQNFAGWARVRARGSAGARIRLRFAETLKPTGEIETTNLRRARATDTYALSGDPDGETFEPRFTYHGFRYVELRSSDAKSLSVLSVEGIVAHSDLPVTGALVSSQPSIEKLWNAALWSQRSNFFGIPTDCPQRDERMGWTGDAQIFWDAAAFNMDIAAFTRRFMGDVRAGQAPTGEMPDTVPFWALGQNTPGWADAATILPWTTWQRYGDTSIIEENWDALDRWQRRLAAQNPDLVWRANRGMDYGDWLSVDAKSREDITTPKELISTAYWAYSTTLMAQMATAIGKDADALRYSGLSAAIRAAFVKNFVSANGRVGNGSQTSAILALRFDLLPVELRKAAVTQLVSDISRRGNKLSTGFLGTPYILDALDRGGATETAMALLLQDAFPSWGFMTANGATTLWERWDGLKDGKVTGSLNHYAFGAVAGFLFRRIAGIDTDGVGFERLRIRPLVDKRLNKGGGRYDSVMGTVSTEWQRDADGAFRLTVKLPANARASVHLPASAAAKISEGRRSIDARKDLRILSRDENEVVIEVPAGDYQFSVTVA